MYVDLSRGGSDNDVYKRKCRHEIRLFVQEKNEPVKTSADLPDVVLVNKLQGLFERLNFYKGVNAFPCAWRCLCNYSQPGDAILDVFSGGGTFTLTSYFMARRAIAIDISPLAIWILRAYLQLGSIHRHYGEKRVLEVSSKLVSALDSAQSRSDDRGQIHQQRSLEELWRRIEGLNEYALRTFFSLTFFSMSNRLNSSKGQAAQIRYRETASIVTLWDELVGLWLQLSRLIHRIEPDGGNEPCISMQSALDLSNIPDNSVGFAFSDPPHYGRFPFSDVNAAYESRLGLLTDKGQEVQIMADMATYQAQIMLSCTEICRVLKPNSRIVIPVPRQNPGIFEWLQDVRASCGFSRCGMEQMEGLFLVLTK